MVQNQGNGDLILQRTKSAPQISGNCSWSKDGFEAWAPQVWYIQITHKHLAQATCAHWLSVHSRAILNEQSQNSAPHTKVKTFLIQKHFSKSVALFCSHMCAKYTHFLVTLPHEVFIKIHSLPKGKNFETQNTLRNISFSSCPIQQTYPFMFSINSLYYGRQTLAWIRISKLTYILKPLEKEQTVVALFMKMEIEGSCFQKH